MLPSPSATVRCVVLDLSAAPSGRGHRRHRLPGREQPPPLRRVLAAQQPRQRDGHELGVGHEAIAVGEGEALHLADEMQVRGRVVPERLQVVSLEQPQLHEHGDAAAVGRLGVDGVPAVVDGDRVHPARLVAGQVLVGEDAAVAGVELGDAAGDVSFIEDVRAFLGHAAQGAREVGLAEDLTGDGRAAAREVDAPGARVVQPLLQHLQDAGELLGEDEALLRQLERGLHHVLPRQRAVRAVERLVALQVGRHRRGQVSGLVGLVLEEVDGRLLRRGAVEVERLDLLRLRHVHGGEALSAHGRVLGIDHRRGERGRPPRRRRRCRPS